MAIQKKLSVRQLVLALIGCQMFETLTWLPELSLLTRPGDLVAVVFAGAALQALLLLPVVVLLKRGECENRYVQGITRFLYFIYFFAAALYLIYCGYVFLSRVIMPQTSGLLLIGIIAAVGCFVAAQDVEAVVKTGSFFSGCMIAVIIFFFFFSLPQADINEIYFLPDEVMSAGAATVHKALRGFAAPLLFVLLGKQREKAGKVLGLSVIGVLILSLLVSTMTVAVLGVVSQVVLFPYFMQSTTAQVHGVLQRLDMVWTAGWGMALLVSVSMYLHSSKSIAGYFRKKNSWLFYAMVGVGAVCIYFAAGNPYLADFFRKSWFLPCIQLFFCVLLPTLLLLLRKKKQRN